MISTMIAIGDEPAAPAASAAAACGTPARAMKIFSSSAPSRIRKIMPLVRAVSSSAVDESRPASAAAAPTP